MSIGSPGASGRRLASVASGRASDGGEALAVATLTAAEFLQSWARIDPLVVRAAFSSGADGVEGGIQFARWIDHSFVSLDGPGVDGFVNRLVGYAGEQRVADLLTAKGHIVEMAATPNNPAWDLLIDDDRLVNVKTVADLASIKGQAAQDGVVYFVPEDAAGTLSAGMVRVEGFSYAETKSAVLDAVSAAKGESALNSLGFHLPWVTFGFAAYRNYQQIQLGKDARYAVWHTGIDTAVKGGGIVVGAAAGAKIGSLGGALGVAFGSVAGGFLGSKLGAELAEHIKRAPLRRAHEQFVLSLDRFGASLVSHAATLTALANAPVLRDRAAVEVLDDVASRRSATLMFRLWPDFCTVAAIAARDSAVVRLGVSEARANDLASILHQGEWSGKYRKLGALMAGTPELSSVVPYDARLLADLRSRRARVTFERRQVNPAWTGSA